MIPYNSNVDIIAIARTADGVGGSTETETVLHANFSCRLNWLSGQKRMMFNKDTYYRDAKMYCDPSDFTRQHQVKYNGVYYEIVDIEDPDNLGRFWQVTLKRLEK